MYIREGTAPEKIQKLPQGSELEDGELAVRLGCVSCAAGVAFIADTEPGDVLGQLRGPVPHTVKKNGIAWSLSGSRECSAAEECPHQDQIFDLTEQLTQTPETEIQIIE